MTMMNAASDATLATQLAGQGKAECLLQKREIPTAERLFLFLLLRSLKSNHLGISGELEIFPRCAQHPVLWPLWPCW